jgi:multiple sugar transport system permease protein
MAVAVADGYRVAGNRAHQRTRSALMHALIVTYFVIAVFPFAWIVSMSLKVPADVVADPPVILFRPTLENYEAVLFGRRAERGEQARTDIPRAFRNSVIVAGASVIVAMVVGNLGAFALAKLRLPAREWVAFFFLSFRFAPALAFIIPTFVVYRTVGLYNTHLGLILMNQLLAVPLIVWTMRSYYEGIPHELFESAWLDGASLWQTIRNVALPLAAPGIAATGILSFIQCWNNFTFPLLLGARETQTVTLATITFISYEQVLWGQMAAAAVVTIVPELILAVLVMGYIVRGLTYGAVKE